MGAVDFIIGGAAKSGTTSLYNYFREHPNVCMSQPKETNYFTMHYDEAPVWYYNKFGHCGNESIRGEASTSYMEFPQKAADRIEKDIPNVRLIFILRDPVERAYSDYWFAVRQGRIEHRPGLFDDLVRGEVDFPDYWHPQCGTGEMIISRGLYFGSLSTYYDRFGEDQIKVLLTQELFDGAHKEVCTFLEVDPYSDSVPESNRGAYPRSTVAYTAYKTAGRVADFLPDSVTGRLEWMARQVSSLVYREEEKPEMDPDTRRYLEDLYQEPTRRLETLIGRDFWSWL